MSHQNQNDIVWMNLALIEAKQGEIFGEVPVGAVIVCNGEFLCSASNSKEKNSDPTGHAEINAIRLACQKLNSWRLTNCTLYVTLEPCFMCAAALVQARIDRVVFGALDAKGGAVESLANLLQHPKLNHQCSHQGGVLSSDCSQILSSFFRKKRLKSKASLES